LTSLEQSTLGGIFEGGFVRNVTVRDSDLAAAAIVRTFESSFGDLN